MQTVHKTVDSRQRPDVASWADRIAKEVWPRFMLNDPIAGHYWGHLYQDWPEYQFALLSADDIVAIGNSVPINWTRPLVELPDDGWDWILPKAADDLRHGRQPNTQVAIQVMVSSRHQRMGLSTHAVAAMKQIGTASGLPLLLVPARPTSKADYPNVSIDDYITWRTPDGLPFDPWLRVHARLGAKIIKPCHRSMRISGTLETWQRWTGISFQQSGPALVPGALCPVIVDMETRSARYV